MGDRLARQKSILQELEDHANGNKAFLLGASFILDVASRAVEIFDGETVSVERKRYLLDFVFSNLKLNGGTLELPLKQPFGAIKEMSDTNEWYPERDSNPRP